MDNRWKIDLDFLESGDIYFFYKPKKTVSEVKNVNDVARFYFVLQPNNHEFSRFIVMGNKKMPSSHDSGDTAWGFVQMVGGRGFTIGKNPKNITKKGVSRPAGEGLYTIIKHRDAHTHLLYSLELPKDPGIVQSSFDIYNEANYIFLERASLKQPNSPDLPFSNFSEVTVENLNKKGTEVLLVGVNQDIGRLGIRVEKERETLDSADVFSKLKVDIERHPAESLISGNWV